ncbi:hypothetical protein [Eisenbergiella sp.]
MAALNAIAREWADELREGIAWVIIWKTGRSWNATAVWLNPDDDTFELEDLDTARKILEQDPNAVMLNGYYCGHLGENMTAAELAAGIRWHYENQYNQLQDSAAFPPEPAADRQHKEESHIAPGTLYVNGNPIDGKLLDLELPELKVDTVSLPDLRSPPSMEMTLTITPDTAASILDSIRPDVLQFVERVTAMARRAWEFLAEAARKAHKFMAQLARQFMDAMLRRTTTHPKWWHLYKHAKKYRVRKKYKRLLQREFLKALAAGTG